MQEVDPKNGRASLFFRENVKKRRFLEALMSLIALKMCGALSPLAHSLKHASGKIMQKLNPKNGCANPF